MDMIYDFCFLYHPHPYEMDPESQVGLGLLSLATYAKELGATVKVINAQGDTLDEAYAKIPDCKYLMLYGCMVDSPIINSFILRHDNCIIGGPIALSPERISNRVLAVVEGLGEDFVQYLIEDEPILLDNIKYYEKGKKVLRFMTLNKNINEYPFPDRSLLEGKTGGNIFKKSPCEVSTTILTSRGCRFKCSFCTSGSNDFHQDYTIDRIEKELEHCLSLGITNIRVSDDNLITNRTRLNLLCSLFKEAGVSWRASIRTFPNYIGLYQTMVESGCKELSFGIESGDQDVLNILNKGLVVSYNTEAVRNALDAGIEVVRALMIMGTPGETSQTVKRNIEWVRIANPSIVSLKMFVPYPGTDIYNNPGKYGCTLFPIENANNSAYTPDGSTIKANIRTDDMAKEELTSQFHHMKNYLEMKGIENRG